jgi:hypothetical protein
VNSQAEAVRIGRVRGWLAPAPAADVVLDLDAERGLPRA